MSVIGELLGVRTITDIKGLAISAGIYLRAFAVLVMIWEVLAVTRTVPRQALPRTVSVAEALVVLFQDGTLVETAFQTTMRATVAFAIAVVIGVSVGLVMSQSRAAEWFFDPLISIGFPVPKVTLLPIFILWFGFGAAPIIVLATTSAFFPIAIATHQGAKGVDRELIWSARSMGVSRRETIQRIVMPASLPNIFNGVQISLFISFVVVVVAEMVTAGGGLGEVLTNSIRFFNTGTAIAVVITISVIGLVFDRGLRLFRAYMLRWT